MVGVMKKNEDNHRLFDEEEEDSHKKKIKEISVNMWITCCKFYLLIFLFENLIGPTLNDLFERPSQRRIFV